MALRSSTSSSDGATGVHVRLRSLPFAGVLAFALVVAIDHLVFSGNAVWEVMLARISEQEFLNHSIVRSKLEVRRCIEPGDERPCVVVLGSSRMERAFDPDHLPGSFEEKFRVARQAHAGMSAFQISAVSNDLAIGAVDLVVIGLSGLDTHSPIRVEPVAGGGNAGASTALALALALGPRDAFEARHSLLRLVAVDVFDAYRYRIPMKRAGFEDWKRFTFDERFPPGRAKLEAIFLPPLVAAPKRRLPPGLAADVEERLIAQYSESPRFDPARKLSGQLGWIKTVGEGRHSEIQLKLFRDAVQTLAAAGVEVLLVEMPLHPVAEELLALELDADFRHLARELDELEGVHWMPVERLGAFPAREFSDPLHIRHGATRRTTRRIVQEIERVLADEKE